MIVRAVVDSEIWIPREDLDSKLESEIQTALNLPNIEKELMKKERIGGWWNLPDFINLWRWETGTADQDILAVPRGFAAQLEAGLKHYGHRVVWDDRRVKIGANFDSFKTIDVRDYQNTAIHQMSSFEQGVWEAPPGAGKTVAVLEMARRLGQKTLIVIDKTNIAEQWRERAESFLGADLGLVGDGSFDKKDITVALQQTLWSRRDELQADGFFEEWGLVVLDECHHLPANTFVDTMSRFTAYWRIGVSGTPYKQEGQEMLVDSTLGPVFWRTTKESLRKAGWLIKPRVRIHKTNFSADFIPTHSSDECHRFPGCQRDPNKKRHQNNYMDIMKELVEDDERNTLIGTKVSAELVEGRTVLVLSKRLGHLDSLMAKTAYLLPDYEGDLFMFTGKESTERRMEIQKRAEEGNCVLFSTIADEALDIPVASSVHFAWPTRNTDTIRQQMGRVERPYLGKSSATINDYLDDCGPLKGQLTDRIEEVYIPDKLVIDADTGI